MAADAPPTLADALAADADAPPILAELLENQPEDAKARRRDWFFTAFPPTDALADAWRAADAAPYSPPPDCRYMCSQVELCPDTERVHMHIFCQFTKALRFNAAKVLFPNSPHTAVCRNPLYARDYCMKPQSRLAGPWTWGEFIAPGQRINISSALSNIEKGATDYELITENPSWAFCHTTLDYLRNAVLNKRKAPLKRDVRCVVLWGPSGTGKTHRARNFRPDDHYVVYTAEDHPWDGYTGQSVLVFEEFDPTRWPITLMNRLLDSWELELPSRYHNKHAFWDTVIITSNISPMSWYLDVPDLLRAALFRRISAIELIKDQDQIVTIKMA